MATSEPAHTLRILISCPDRPGIIAAVSRFLYERDANIVRSDQFSTDPVGGEFFLRMEFTLPVAKRAELAEEFGLSVASRFDMSWRLWDASRPKRIAILVSRYDHCLQELLWRWRRGELDGAPAVTDEPARDLLVGLETRAELLDALERLTQRQRAVLVLRYFNDLTEAQTAEVLGCSPGTVKSSASRGLARLREVLTPIPNPTREL